MFRYASSLVSLVPTILVGMHTSDAVEKSTLFCLECHNVRYDGDRRNEAKNGTEVPAPLYPYLLEKSFIAEV